jgi:hypothetical protein
VLVPLGCAVAGPVMRFSPARRPVHVELGPGMAGPGPRQHECPGVSAGSPPRVCLVVCWDCVWSGRIRDNMNARGTFPARRPVECKSELESGLCLAGPAPGPLNARVFVCLARRPCMMC